MSLTGEATAGRFIEIEGARRERGIAIAGALSSDPRSPIQHAEACGEWVFAREYPERDRNLAAPAHTQLRA
jgi:hypothetical protein